jgi:HK97 family phage major capsid protein
MDLKRLTDNELLRHASGLRAELASATGERAENLQDTIASVEAEAARRPHQLERIRAQARNPTAAVPGSGGRDPEGRWTPSEPRWGRERGPGPSEACDLAMRAIEANSRILSAQAGDRLVDVVERDQTGGDARYLAAIADPLYETAFARAFVHGPMAHLRMSPEELAAFQATMRAAEYRETFGGGFQASGPLGVGSSNLPLPITVDPTVLLTSTGVVNPIRQFADVRTITTHEYIAATSPSMTAEWAAEGDEVGDDTPSFNAITIKPQRAQAFATYSIEASMDWSNIATELQTMLADARDVLEADAFLTGAGEASNEPEGILVGASTAVQVTSSTATAIQVTDLRTTQEDLPPRYQPNARWFSNLSTRNAIDQIVAQADATHAKITDAQGNILRRPWSEVSKMDSIGASNTAVIYGDLSRSYRIVDRIGMAVEIVPHIFGSNRRPTGVRGFYSYWRVSAQVVNEQGLRYLTMHS